MTEPAARPLDSAWRFARRARRRARRAVVAVRGQRVIVVLGMHRSGTSSLAGSLEEAGLFLGGDRLASEARFNAKGNREPKRLNRLHEGLLNANGGTWFAPPASVQWSDRDRQRRDDFIRSRAGERVWGFKDPRTLLVMDGWLEALPEMEMVASVRDPMAVATSLLRRAESTDKRSRDLTLEDWLALWRTYNQHLLALYERFGFPLVDFDLPPDRYEQRIEGLIEELGLKAPSSRSFFDASLRTSDKAAEEAQAELPEDVSRLYTRLKEIARS